MALKTLYFALILFLNIKLATAQFKFKPEDYNCIAKPVVYISEGKPEKGLFFMVCHHDTANACLHYSSLFLLKKGERGVLVTDDLTGVYGLSISGKSTYAAILTAGEGNSWIEIVKVQDLIDTKKYNPAIDIQAYPGNVSIVKWLDDNRLLIESDIDLRLKNEKRNLTDKNLFEKPKQFVFDLSKNWFTMLK